LELRVVIGYFQVLNQVQYNILNHLLSSQNVVVKAGGVSCLKIVYLNDLIPLLIHFLILQSCLNLTTLIWDEVVEVALYFQKQIIWSF